MDSGKQRIVYYFIEEAKEHLDTLEQGLLDLGAVMADQERVNEMFRAAHSVKGGAAMLGFDSIKTTAHRLEDCFKILKENPVKVDQNLESMFLKGYDTLKDLVERLQGPFGLREDEAEKTVQEAEPNFVELLAYLDHLVGAAGGATEAPAPVAKAAAPASKKVKAPAADATAQVTDVLRQMLQLFKEKETAASRQQFSDLCKRLVGVGIGIGTWETLIKTAYRAIANPKNSYRTLAPVVIKEIKQASELLTAGKTDAIAPSPTLKQLAAAPEAAPTPAAATPKQTTATAAPETPKQITIPLETRAAAKALLQAFNKKQVLELVQILHKATR